MNTVAVANLQTQIAERGIPSRSGSHTVPFQEFLAASINDAMSASRLTLPFSTAKPASGQQTAPVIVRPGDSLSKICAEQLAKQGSAVSQREIHAAVQKVAQANHLADPNKIYVGQKLNTSVLAEFAPTQDTLDAAIAEGRAKNWHSLVEGAIALSSEFGTRKDPYTGRIKSHKGIDVVAPAGAQVSALTPGSVTFSGWKRGYGNTVIIRHQDGLESLYGHVSKPLVKVGDQVTSETPIARVGTTGRTTGPHLHFEVRKNGQALDPIAILQKTASPTPIAENREAKQRDFLLQ